jgi:hypothetical protein
MKKRQANDKEPTIAPSLSTDQILEQDASKEEIKRGDYTQVIHLSYDEVGPSRTDGNE